MNASKHADKSKLTKKSPYLKDQSIWEARQDVNNQYLMQAQVAAATVYPKGSQMGCKLSRLRALSPLGQKKAKKAEKQTELSSTTFTDDAYGDKILAHANAERLAFLQSSRGSTGFSSHTKLSKAKKKEDKSAMIESSHFYDESYTICDTPLNKRFPCIVNNSTYQDP